MFSRNVAAQDYFHEWTLRHWSELQKVKFVVEMSSL